MAQPYRSSAALLLLALAACNHSRTAAVQPTSAPAFVGDVAIAANTNPWVPQAAVLSLETDVATQVELRIDDGQRIWNVVADATFATAHPRVPVVGLRADRDHVIDVTVRGANGATTKAPQSLHFTTPPLPAGFPPLRVDTSLPQYAETGVRLVSILTNNLGSIPTVIDTTGEVLWYLDASKTPLFGSQVMAFPMQNGNLMLIGAWRVMVEVDLLGDIRSLFLASGLTGAQPGIASIDTDSFHHDFVEMPAGSGADFAVLGTERRSFPDYPVDVLTPTAPTAPADVIGDEIVEFNRDGTVVRRFRLFDLLDPYRVTYDSLGNFWDSVYGISTRDWSHANALVLDHASDSWIVSLRHQDAVVKIGRQTGAIEWICGDHGRWNAPWNQHLLTPVGVGFEWHYHQHAPELQPDASIMMFDNGNGRAIPPAPLLPAAQAYSRAVRYRIDAAARTVEQVWAYGGPPGTGQPSFYSFFVSSAYHMPNTGNVLVCDGGKPAGNGQMFARLFEVTTEPLPQVVFDCTIGDGTGAGGESYFAYRAYRLPGLYR